jgi:hypothetical protein
LEGDVIYRPQQKGGNFDEFKSGGLREKHAVATWNLGTIPAFAYRQRKTKKTCDEMAGRRTFRMHTDYYPAVRQNIIM